MERKIKLFALDLLDAGSSDLPASASLRLSAPHILLSKGILISENVTGLAAFEPACRICIPGAEY